MDATSANFANEYATYTFKKQLFYKKYYFRKCKFYKFILFTEINKNNYIIKF